MKKTYLLCALLLSSCAQADYAHDTIDSILGIYAFEECYVQMFDAAPLCYEFMVEIEGKFSDKPNVKYTVEGYETTRELMGNAYATDEYIEVLFDRYGPEDLRPVHDYEDGVRLFRLEIEDEVLYFFHFRSPVDDVLIKDRYELTKVD